MIDLDPTLLLLLVPLAVVQLGPMVLAIVDLLKPERRVRGGSKGMWAVIVVFVNLIGPILYLLAGRLEGEGVPEDEAPAPGAMPGWGSPHDPPPVAAARTPTAAPVAAAGPGPAPGGRLPAPRSSEALPDVDPSAARGAAIRVEGLAKRYPGAGILALDHLTLAVPTGSVFGLLGPNGAGKTTTLRLLAGLTRPTAGRAEIAGRAVADDPLGVRRQLGYLEQDPRAYGWLTGREQVALVGRLHGLAGRELDAAVEVALERVGLRDAAGRRAATYSGGMRQRLGIAGALVHRPAVIVLDEPVSSLDPEGRRDVLGLIAELRGGATVLFSTHVLADVERICDRVGILDHGRLVVEGPLAALLDRYALPVYRVEAEPGQLAALESLTARVRDLDWVTGAALEHGLLTIAVADPERAARELLPVVAESGLAVVSLARARPTLEDVFLRLTGDGRESAA